MVQNDAGTAADSWHKADTAGSREVPGSCTPGIENPGALAGATGAAFDDLRIKARGYRKGPGDAMRADTDRLHNHVAEMVEGAFAAEVARLHGFIPDIWGNLAQVLRESLTPRERALLAFAALRSVDGPDRLSVIDAVQMGGYPNAH